MPVRNGILSQEIDVQGSLNVSNTRSLTDETNAFGAQISTGTGDTIGGAAPTMTLTDAGAAFTAQDVGRFLTIAGATTGANNGTFLIVGFTSSTVISYNNAAGVAEAFTGTWTITKPYSIEDDINFARTDRRNIKGTASHVTDVPTYERPTAVGTPVPANLTNIASKTTDAKALVVNRKYSAVTVGTGNTAKTIFSSGNLDHADATDRTGVPIQDGADAGAHLATYVEIIDPATEAGLEVLGGGDAGKRVFGRTRVGTPVAATGSITTIAGASLVDGETFILNDGVNPAVTFEFDDDASVVETATLRAVAFTGGDTADQVRDTIITAVNGAPTLAITASNGGAATVDLDNDNVGSHGNIAIQETVANGGFAVTGMSGGSGSASPNSVEVEFRAVANGADLSTSVAYTWEAGQPTSVDFYYGFRERLDNLTETALRTVLTNGIVADADMSQDIIDIRTAIGIADGATSLTGLLTNTGTFFIFNGADADPTVVELFNLINAQVGSRDYTGSILSDGQTITASLQALSDAIAGSSFVRTVERLTSENAANVARTLPGAQTYTLDGSNNGQNLTLFWTKLLRDPGPVVDDNDYAETSTTQFTPYTKIKNGDHINYYLYA